MSLFEIILAIEVGIIAVVHLIGAIPKTAVIILGVILLIVGIFAARQILWPLGAILIVVGVIVALALHSTGHAYY